MLVYRRVIQIMSVPADAQHLQMRSIAQQFLQGPLATSPERWKRPGYARAGAFAPYADRWFGSPLLIWEFGNRAFASSCFLYGNDKPTI